MTDFNHSKTNYDIESQVERFHWWFAVRRKLLYFLIQSLHLSKDTLTLDIGCGTGSNLTILISTGMKVFGLDRSLYALTLAQKKINLPMINGDLDILPFRPNSIGLIIAMDILEHLEKDANGLNEIYKVLEKGGILIITVPAFKSLGGIQDVVTGHKRRYSLKEISNKLRLGGFNILRSSYFNLFLFFPIFFARRIIQLFGSNIESENKINFPLINFFLKIIFSIELYILKYISFPFGVSIFCVARKD